MKSNASITPAEAVLDAIIEKILAKLSTKRKPRKSRKSPTT